MKYAILRFYRLKRKQGNQWILGKWGQLELYGKQGFRISLEYVSDIWKVGKLGNMDMKEYGENWKTFNTF